MNSSLQVKRSQIASEVSPLDAHERTKSPKVLPRTLPRPKSDAAVPKMKTSLPDLPDANTILGAEMIVSSKRGSATKSVNSLRFSTGKFLTATQSSKISSIVAAFQAQLQYSESKMVRFHEYCQEYSKWSLCFHLLTPMVVPVIVVFLFMCVPVSPPEVQVFSNYGLLFQVLFLGFTTGIVALTIFTQLLPENTLCVRDQSILLVSLPLNYIIFGIMWVYIIGYPVPFAPVIAGCPAVVIALLEFAFRIRTLEHVRAQIRTAFKYCMLFTGTYVLYTAVAVSYSQLAKHNYTHLKLAPICFLPIAKYFIKHAIQRIADEAQADFVLTSSKSVGQFRETVLLLSFDVIENVFMIQKMRQKIAEIKHSPKMVLADADTARSLSLFRLASQTLFDQLQVSSLRLFFRSEMLLLTEYIETIVPLMYGAYVSFMRYLPNRKYVSGVREVDLPDEVYTELLKSLFIYSGLEVASLLVVRSLFKSNFDHPVIRQIGFAIKEKEVYSLVLISGWMVFAVMGELEHMGMDYTFEFAWLKH